MEHQERPRAEVKVLEPAKAPSGIERDLERPSSPPELYLDMEEAADTLEGITANAAESRKADDEAQIAQIRSELGLMTEEVEGGSPLESKEHDLVAERVGGLENDTQAAEFKHRLENSQEKEREIRLGGTVIYDRGPSVDPLDTKILLYIHPNDGDWYLPSTPTEDGDGIQEVGSKIEDVLKIKIDMEEGIDDTRLKDEKGNTMDFYSATANSSEPLALEGLVHWFTIRELQEGSVRLHEMVTPNIQKVLEMIEAKEKE